MSVICIGSVKGGAGKTTIATNIAAIAAYTRKNRYALIDADPQLTSYNWWRQRESGTERMHPLILCSRALGQEAMTAMCAPHPYEGTIIDTGGHDSVEFRAALLYADRLYIPVIPSQFDLDSLAHTLNLMVEARKMNKKLRAFAIINQAPTTPTSNRVEVLRNIIRDFGDLQLCKTVLHHRAAYKDAASEGKGVNELKGQKKANEEMHALLKEINSHA